MASEDAHDVVVDVTVVGCDSSRYAGFRRSIEMLSMHQDVIRNALCGKPIFFSSLVQLVSAYH